jgi:pyridoxamine 5'-phosphate oxidase
MERNPLHTIRKEYLIGQLFEKNMNPDPIHQFSDWLNLALEKGVIEPNAMMLATVDQSGCPSARVVLLKYVSQKGFVFFTNYGSQKGENIFHNPNVALLFFWGVLERQIRIVGRAEKIKPSESDEYFESRPLDSRLAAYASPQSKVIPNRDYVVDRMLAYKKLFEAKDIKRPDNWGGYRVVPESIEFWQGGPARLHDRIRYTLINNKWTIERLAP